MSVYVPTMHSKIRFCERVDSNYANRDETIRLAKKYGLTLKDIPKKYKKERDFLGTNKIFYNDKIYIFSNSKCYKLITIYNNFFPNLKRLFDRKEVLRKQAKKEQKMAKDKISVIYVEAVERIFEVTFINGKIAKLRKMTDKKEYKNVNHPITKAIAKIYKGDFVNYEIFLNLDYLNPMDKAIYYEVLRIPYGQSITFKMLAKRLNNRYSIQAITSSLKNCPFLFLIPSHRVIRSDGKLGSYCCKPRFKRRLLKREKIKFKN